MTDWYYHDPAQGRVGPLSTDQLRARYADRRVQRDTLAWHAGAHEWQPLERYAEDLQLHTVTPDASQPPPLPPAQRAVAPTASRPAQARARSAPPPMATMARWYYSDYERNRHGPVDDRDMAQLHADGQIGPETLAWREGLAQWQPWRTLAGEVVSNAPAPPARATFAPTPRRARRCTASTVRTPADTSSTPASGSAWPPRSSTASSSPCSAAWSAPPSAA